MKNVYLCLALLGALVPMAFFAQHFAEEGFAPLAFVSALFVNPAAAGFTADILISSLVFWTWAGERNGPHPGKFVLLNCCIGLSCALPAYLYACARAEEAQRTSLALSARG